MPTGIYDRPSLETRFWARVDKTDGCWLWKGSTCRGYGRISVENRIMRAHRASWELAFGKIPDGLYVLHHCDNNTCVRPDHLFLGTQKDNIQDCVQKGRLNTAIGEKRGSTRLTVEQVLLIRQKLKLGIRARELANEYGVNRSTIYHIKQGRNWKWLDSGAT